MTLRGSPQRRWRRALWIALLPAAALLVWLTAAALPIWTLPQSDWLDPAVPGRCAAVAALRARTAQRASPPPLPEGEGAAAAQAALDGVVAGLRVHPSGLAAQGVFDGAARPAWLFTAGETLQDGSAAPAFVGIIWIDGESGAPLDVIVGVEDPAAVCALNLRRAARDTLFSPPFLLLSGYTGICIVYLAARWLLRRGRRPRFVGKDALERTA
ncbi:MAG: hypothetical protein JNL42_11305 [Anaerolineae bacterium]|nr:hypothetical protein [Anaerolineae bacterium]